MSQVEIEQAKEQLSELVDQVAGGDEVVITRDQQPVARIVAVEERKRTFGSARGLIQIEDDFDEPLKDFGEYT